MANAGDSSQAPDAIEFLKELTDRDLVEAITEELRLRTAWMVETRAKLNADEQLMLEWYNITKSQSR